VTLHKGRQWKGTEKDLERSTWTWMMDDGYGKLKDKAQQWEGRNNGPLHLLEGRKPKEDIYMCNMAA